MADPGSLSCTTPSNETTATLPLTLNNITGLINDTTISDSTSGYDFTEKSEQTATSSTTDTRVVSSTSGRCDIYFKNDTSISKKILYSINGIKDLGEKDSLNTIGSVSTTGYSTNAEVTANHCYAIKTAEGYYTKLRVENVSDSSLYFKWSLQPVSGNSQF